MNKNWLKIMAIMVFVVAGSWALGSKIYQKRVEHQAFSDLKTYAEKGYDALALELAEEYRHSLTTTEEKCELMVNLYYRTQVPARLEWTSQSCLTNGIDTPIVHLGFSAAREMAKDNNKALAVVAEGLKKHEDSVELLFRAGILLKNMNRFEEAAAVLKKAAEKNPDNMEITSNAFLVLYELGNWKEAHQYTKPFKLEELNNPVLALMLTRVHLQNKDMENAAQAKEKASQLMTLLRQQGRSEDVAALEKSFAAELALSSARLPTSSPSEGLAPPSVVGQKE